MQHNPKIIGDLATFQHFVNQQKLKLPIADGLQVGIFALGCFWGAERLFWKQQGVQVTAVGYCGGSPGETSYKQVCSGQTGHAEAVLVVFDPKVISFESLLTLFWENHDPTQGDRQGNDVGSQYRSAVFYMDDEQSSIAQKSLEGYQKSLGAAGKGPITTELSAAPEFYLAEPEHQQYLAKNPAGYCGLKGTGVSCLIS